MLAEPQVLDYLSLADTLRLQRVDRRHRETLVSSRAVKRLLWRGGLLPSERASLWCHLLTLPRTHSSESSAYLHLRSQQSEYTTDIDKDIPRTFMVRSDLSLQQSLRRILIAFASGHSDVGYCQGMNFIAGTLLVVLKDEEKAFYALEGLFRRLQLDSLFKPGVPDLLKRHFQFGYYLKQCFPDLSAHFKRIGVTSGIFVDKWCMGLFSSYLPMETLLKAWDVFLWSGWKALVKVGMSALSELRPLLLEMDLENLSIYLRDHTRDNHQDGKSLLSSASRLKVTAAGLKRLDGEFLIEQAEHKVEHTDRYVDLTAEERRDIEKAKTDLARFQPLLRERIETYQEAVETLEREVDALRAEKDDLQAEIETIQGNIEAVSNEKGEIIEKIRRIEAKTTSVPRTYVQLAAFTFECVSIQPESLSNPHQSSPEDTLRSHLSLLESQLHSLQQSHKAKVSPKVGK